MANVYTDIDKWNDDWFLGLSPRLKTVWTYLCENVAGCGEIKVSVSKISFCVGEPITIEELNQVFAGRLIWLTDDVAWIPGTTARIYKTLSPKIPAHLNAAKKILRMVEGVALPDRGIRVRDRFQAFLDSHSLQTSPPDQALPSDCSGPDLKDKGERIKDKKPPEEGVGEDRPEITPRKLAELWNAGVSNAKTFVGRPMPQVDLSQLKPSQKRWTAARARLADHPTAEYWTDVIERIARSEFCRGKGAKGNWLADFDFLTRPDTSVGVLEGKYGCSPKRVVQPVTSTIQMDYASLPPESEIAPPMSAEQREANLTKLRELAAGRIPVKGSA